MALSRRRKQISLVVWGGLACAMVGLAFGAVPLYSLFCQATGYGGTTQVADAEQAESQPLGDRVVTIRFNSDVGRDMPWRFKPAQREITVRVGEMATAFYTASNPSQRTILGKAIFNVTPHKAGLYFDKVDCFCSEEQVLAPGESAELPVTFFVDPEIVDDHNMNDVKTITLSYTFFDRGEDALKEHQQEIGPLASNQESQPNRD